MSIPFRERNPVPIGAVGLLVIARRAAPRLQRARPPAHRRRRRLPRGLHRGRRHQARRRRAHRRRQGRQGHRRRPRGRPRAGRLHGSPRTRSFGPQTGAAVRMKTLLGKKYLALDPRAGPARRGQRRSRSRGPSRPTTSSTPSGPHDDDRADRHRPAREVARASSRPSSRTARQTSRPPSTACRACPAPSRRATPSCGCCCQRPTASPASCASRNEQVRIAHQGRRPAHARARKRRDDIHTLFRNTSRARPAAHRSGARQPGPADAGPRPARRDPRPAAEARRRPAEDDRRHGARSPGSSPTRSATAGGSTRGSPTSSSRSARPASPCPAPSCPTCSFPAPQEVVADACARVVADAVRAAPRPGDGVRQGRHGLVVVALVAAAVVFWPRSRQTTVTCRLHQRGRPLPGLRRADPRRQGRQGRHRDARGRPRARRPSATTTKYRVPAVGARPPSSRRRSSATATSSCSPSTRPGPALAAGTRDPAGAHRGSRRARPVSPEPRRPHGGARSRRRQQERRAQRPAAHRRAANLDGNGDKINGTVARPLDGAVDPVRQPRRPLRHGQEPPVLHLDAGRPTTRRCGGSTPTSPRVADQLSEERGNLKATLESLGVALDEVSGFVARQPGAAQEQPRPRGHA